MYSQNLFPAEFDRLDESFLDPHDRKTARELFFELFIPRKEAIDWIAKSHSFKSEKEYCEAIKGTIRDCVDTVVKGFEKFRDSR